MDDQRKAKIKAFFDEFELLKKKYQFDLINILNFSEDSISPGFKIVDKLPEETIEKNGEAAEQPKPTEPQPQPQQV